MKNSKAKENNNFDLSQVVSTAIQLPGVKVMRNKFLSEQFNDKKGDLLSEILEKGPVEAGISRDELKHKANRLIKERTTISTGASFVAGIPGGLAMAATIPADLIQFYGVALRMAQELVYLYGEEDIWCEGTPDSEKVTNQLLLYCGVMLGATGAAQTVRVMSSALAKQALKKLPQKALTKTLYYPVIKAIMKFFGVSVTKTSFSKVVSKAIPIVGGVVSGGITLASMLPMGNRLRNTLDKAHFDYTEEDFNADMIEIQAIADEDIEEANTVESAPIEKETQQENIFEQIKEAKDMLDQGVIDEEEFKQIKSKLIDKMNS